MTTLRNNYWMIWQLEKCGSVEFLIDVCHRYNITQLLIKVLDGTVPFNRLGRSDDRDLLTWLRLLRAAGISVDGWPFVYALISPGAQGDAIMERREKLDLEIILANIEERPFENLTETERNRFMNIYWEKQHQGTQYGLCSHRYPEWHPYIPYKNILKRVQCDVNTPMVYWEGLHDPIAQLNRSFAEYEKIVPGKPFMPMGSAYARGDWSPTLVDFTGYVNHCESKGWVWGFYSLDYVIRFSKWDWMEAITGVTPYPDFQPPGEVIVTAPVGASIRKTPVIDPTNANRLGVVPRRYELYVEGPAVDGFYPIRAFVHSSLVEEKP